jgi:ribonuclease P protein component
VDLPSLKSNLEFRRVVQKGKFAASGPIVVYALRTDGPTRIGITTGKRVGKAVQRNRAKRWVREALRHAPQPDAPPMEIVVMVKDPFEDFAFAAFREDVLLGLEKAISFAARVRAPEQGIR